MEKSHLIFSLFLSVFLLFQMIHERSTVDAAGSHYGSDYGYVEVREGAQMFWLYYESPNKGQNSTWPIILWLQGGPGSSAVGYGNFFEIGPVDNYLNERNSTWLGVADLLFVDSPVGTGFSYVNNQSLLVKSDDAAAVDLTTLLISFFDEHESLQEKPLYIMGESYGGRIAAKVGLKALDAIEDGKLKVQLGGVVLGSSWISPLVSLSSWPSLLKDMSRLETDDSMKAISLLRGIKEQLKAGNFVDAAISATYFGANITEWSNNVSFYNFLLDNTAPTVEPKTAKFNGSLTKLMNTEIKKAFPIIPKSVVWEELSNSVYYALLGEFMKPRTKEVGQLLEKGVNVTIFSGQLDLMCSTRGTEAWVEKIKWNEIKSFLSSERHVITCGKDPRTRGFFKFYKNLISYSFLNAGHYVVVDQAYIALRMIARITQSPALEEDLCIPHNDQLK